ncbi:MAG: IS5 family transposase [Hyphomicrobiaceae bacterium]|nr:IS5 family transposase [Hyphomicrobiaceae bacterium]
MRQKSFAEGTFEKYRKPTRRERFLTEMETVIPWRELCEVIEPFYPKPEGAGRPPVGLERMLRIHFLQHWFNLSDPAVEEALYDSRAMRNFVGIDLGQEPAPDETTICKFRHLLEAHNLGERLFALIGEYLEENGLKVSTGTIVDATIINAPGSTKNLRKERDPEMHQTKKGNQWYFGMKAHIGVDARSGLVHTAGVTTGKVHDAKVMDNLIRADDRAVFADKGYVNEKKKRAARRAGVYWAVKEKPKAGRRLSSSQIKRNRRHGAVRAKVEHVFRVLKCQFGYRKVRYRGIEKNDAQVSALLALANLFLARRQLRCA